MPAPPFLQPQGGDPLRHIAAGRHSRTYYAGEARERKSERKGDAGLVAAIWDADAK